jgi:hypothetical protein
MAIAVCTLGLLATSAAWGAYVEYQGPNGNLNVAGNWYVITDPGDPASRTGETRLPAKGGTLGSFVRGDDAILRNGTTTTVNTSMESGQWSIGEPQITGQPTAPATTMYIPSGGTLSLRGDDPYDLLQLNVGGPYPATLNVNGGDVNINWYRGGNINVGSGSGTTGTLNLSSGAIQVETAFMNSSDLHIGHNGGTGVVNQSGGLISRPGQESEGSIWEGLGDGGILVGHGGYGEYNISGGYARFADNLRIGTTYTASDDTTTAGTGLLTVTGGTFQFGRKGWVGSSRGGMANVGHIRVLGGTFQSHKWVPEKTEAGCSDLYIGVGESETCLVNAVGKITITQDAVIRTLGLIMGLDGHSTTSCQMELKLGRAGDFSMLNTDWFDVKGTFEVSLTGGYQPAPDTEWMVGQLTHLVAPESLLYIDPDLAITPGFHLESRNGALDLYLVCDALQHPGDANNDGAVNVGDLGILAGNWQQVTVLGKAWKEGDFTGDDVVNVGDLGVLAGAWGWTGTPVPPPPGQVPEPASLALLALGAFAMLRRRR